MLLHYEKKENPSRRLMILNGFGISPTTTGLDSLVQAKLFLENIFAIYATSKIPLKLYFFMFSVFMISKGKQIEK